MPNKDKSWYFYIYVHDKLNAQLSLKWNKFITPWSDQQMALPGSDTRIQTDTRT